MELIKKTNVTATLRLLDQNDRAEFPLSSVAESSVRTACSRLKYAVGAKFMIERTARNLIVTRL